ncbi:hypothetical protein O3P69_012732 [Scylla paramamosain]|uniref:PDEase domain-containing protein n=1 Tax=Scylla paramamosain TaxID=85552 RepID=A0AAW0SFZ5_SCYPA
MSVSVLPSVSPVSHVCLCVSASPLCPSVSQSLCPLCPHVCLCVSCPQCVSSVSVSPVSLCLPVSVSVPLCLPVRLCASQCLFYVSVRLCLLRLFSVSLRLLSVSGVTEACESVVQHKVSSAPVEKERFSFSRASHGEEGAPGNHPSSEPGQTAPLQLKLPLPESSIISQPKKTPQPTWAQALERAIEILRSTELYSPQLISSAAVETSVASRSVVTDPVATDLLGGPLMLILKCPLGTFSVPFRHLWGLRTPLGHPSSTPGALEGTLYSNDIVKATQQLPRSSVPALHQQASSAIRELLAEDMSWSFDIFKLERISDKRPLVWLGMSLMCRFDVPRHFKLR